MVLKWRVSVGWGEGVWGRLDCWIDVLKAREWVCSSAASREWLLVRTGEE